MSKSNCCFEATAERPNTPPISRVVNSARYRLAQSRPLLIFRNPSIFFLAKDNLTLTPLILIQQIGPAVVVLLLLLFLLSIRSPIPPVDLRTAQIAFGGSELVLAYDAHGKVCYANKTKKTCHGCRDADK
jgi:hypothetical protein